MGSDEVEAFEGLGVEFLLAEGGDTVVGRSLVLNTAARGIKAVAAMHRRRRLEKVASSFDLRRSSSPATVPATNDDEITS